MTAASLAFPDRPLTVRPPGHSLWPQIVWLVVTLVMSLGLWMIVRDQIPDLRDDWAIRETAEPIPEADIEDGHCTARLILVICEAKLTLASTTGSAIRHETHQFFLDFHFGDYSAAVMADPARPGYLTTSLALSKVWNRIITLTLFVPLFLGFAGLMIVGTIKQFRDRQALRRALNGQPLRPVALVLLGRNRQVWRVGNTSETGSLDWRDWTVPVKHEPIVLDSNRSLVLGVTAGDGSMWMPLNEKLSWIGLTDGEREALRRSLQAAA